MAKMKKKRAFREIASKAWKTIILERDPWLKRYIPQTIWFDETQLKAMLYKYGIVFIKPDKGGGGVGIIRVTKLADGLVECKSLKHERTVPIEQVVPLVQTYFKPNKRYLLQRGIPLAKLGGRPFDIRLMLQRVDHSWELTGLAAKIAAPGKVVTNFCKGGQPYEIKSALRRVCRADAAKKLRELKALAHRVAHVLSERFHGLCELGIDVGLDENGAIWIFEVNTRPTVGMFRKLKNMKMYYKIRRNRKHHI